MIAASGTYCLPLLGRSSILVVPSSALALQHSSHLADVRPAGICSDHFKNTGDFSVRYLSVYWLYILILILNNKNKEPG